MSLLYTPIYAALLVICFTQSFYPIYMLLAMLFRQSRLLYAFFHNVDKVSKRHGGELVAQVLKSHGVDNIFTLPGGHVSPIVVASEKLKIRIVDVRHEATAVFAADASARLRGVPGVAVVTAGPGLTNTVTAIKNAQMAESPVVVIAGAAATMLKNRGSLQDIDQVSLLKSATKKCFSVDCVRDIAPTLREAFRISQVDTPGPVFVELPVDILYPYNIISEQFSAMSTKKNPTTKQSIKSRIIEAYSNYCLDHIFADAWKDCDFDPMPITVCEPKPNEVAEAARLLRTAKRPIAIVGSQSMVRPYAPGALARNLRRLGIPVYLNGSARGLMGSNYDLQFRHARKEAVREADVVFLLGAVCDFRLGYGRILSRRSKVISVNRSIKSASMNSKIFWQPTLTICSDVGRFVDDLALNITGRRGSLDEAESDDDNNNYEPRDHEDHINIDKEWVRTLVERDQTKDRTITEMASKPTERYLNPLHVLHQLKHTFKDHDTILVADGGDFVASAAYILKPNGPLRWLDPGPFGTLGCGAGFALAAKLTNPEKKVVLIMGDGAFGYAIPELDTLARHKVPVLCLIGNDACWTQIAREQVPMLGSSIGCDLAYTNYHQVAEGFGAKGYKIEQEVDLQKTLENARIDLENGSTVVVNCLIGKTSFRDGSISV